ncbi:hypothetical protein GY45DRAFT_559689 [Cubamyces sp. BRFM 1775]|nr:hypothetical protein GY45DRAFT_559689 [Cubamyces sp. BRFM 1775]
MFRQTRGRGEASDEWRTGRVPTKTAFGVLAMNAYEESVVRGVPDSACCLPPTREVDVGGLTRKPCAAQSDVMGSWQLRLRRAKWAGPRGSCAAAGSSCVGVISVCDLGPRGKGTMIGIPRYRDWLYAHCTPTEMKPLVATPRRLRETLGSISLYLSLRETQLTTAPIPLLTTMVTDDERSVFGTESGRKVGCIPNVPMWADASCADSPKVTVRHPDQSCPDQRSSVQ